MAASHVAARATEADRVRPGPDPDLRRFERERELARLTEVDRATAKANAALCGVAALLAFGLAPRYGLALGFVSSLPFLSWVLGFAGLRRLLGLRRWTALNLLVIEATIVLDVSLTGGTESPFLHMIGVLGSFIVFYFPGRWQALAATPIIVIGAATLPVLAGSSFDDPLNVAVAFMIALIVPVTFIRVVEMELRHRRRAVIDPLTGCLNRHAFSDRIELFEAQMAVTGEPIGLVMFDIDHFKQVNDRHGHAAGDAVLTEVAYAIRKALRSYELLCRLGGEEFAILLPGAGVIESGQIAERIRALVEQIEVEGVSVTISCGVAVAEGRGADLQSVLAQADEALYEAKDAGRNQIRYHAAAAVG